MPEENVTSVKRAVAVVVIKVAGVVGEVGLEDVEPSIAVIIATRHTHAGLLMAILAVSASGHTAMSVKVPS